jgi:hypothetical protein
MLFDLGVWIGSLIILLPVPVLGLAWTRRCRFYQDRPAQHRQRVFYFLALATASASTLAYLGYWAWRVYGLYQVTFPFIFLLTLERSMYACRLLSASAVLFLLFGRGPYRVLVLLTTLWVMLQLWVHGGVIHWA